MSGCERCGKWKPPEARFCLNGNCQPRRFYSVNIPLSPGHLGFIGVPEDLFTQQEWDLFMHILDVMKPGLVREEESTDVQLPA